MFNKPHTRGIVSSAGCLLVVHPPTHRDTGRRGKNSYRLSREEYLAKQTNTFITGAIAVLLTGCCCNLQHHNSVSEPVHWWSLNASLHPIAMQCVESLSCCGSFVGLNEERARRDSVEVCLGRGAAAAPCRRWMCLISSCQGDAFPVLRNFNYFSTSSSSSSSSCFCSAYHFFVEAF